MPLPSAIMATAASFLNDTAQQVFTNTAQLPYLNQALRDLQEQYLLYDIPVTYETSGTLDVAAGVSVIAAVSTTPVLPTGLIEIKRLFASQDGQNAWGLIDRKDFLSHLDDDVDLDYPIEWAWIDNEIHIHALQSAIDLKLDYIRSVFSVVTNPATEIGIKFESAYSYLAYRTAAHCALYIGENVERAMQLYGEAGKALGTALGIAIKGKTAIPTRRLPFRFGYRNRRGLIG